MGDNLHDRLKRKASMLSLHFHSLLSVASVIVPVFIYPFDLHFGKSEDSVCLSVRMHMCSYVRVEGIPKLISQISNLCLDTHYSNGHVRDEQ